MPSRSSVSIRGLHLFGVLLFGSLVASACGAAETSIVPVSPDGVWTGTVDASGARRFELDDFALFRVLHDAPLEDTEAARTAPVVLALPMPDGSYARFSVVESPVLSAALAAQHPELRTYRAQGLDDPAATARFDRTPLGFHAIVVTPQELVFIGRATPAAQDAPATPMGDDVYTSVARQDLPAPDGISCTVDEANAARFLGSIPRTTTQASEVGTLRTLDLAIATTAEFTAFFGGTAGAQAAVVQHVSQVNAIYERELSVRFQLVCLTTYTNAATDPFTNPASVDGTLITQADEALDATCGVSAYHVGHLFHRRAGEGYVGYGRAHIGGACGGMKGRGASSSTRPDLPSFVVDLVAHELAHQLGANHTYNSTGGGCVERFGAAAFEVGAGTTLMSYACAGCGAAEDPPGCADPYFHTHSYDEITGFLAASGCGRTTSTGNRPPTVDAGPDRVIPRETPFTLTATGSDPERNYVTWSWEEYDLGAASPPLNGSVSGPLFRSFPPTPSPQRTFPNPADLLARRPTPFEILPTVDRTLAFRVTARDNRSGGGALAYDTVVLTVRGEPFRLLAPNGGQGFDGGAAVDVIWQVGGGNVAPNVNIAYSIDGGRTFPVVLAANVPNDGSHRVTLPAAATDLRNARIRVEGAGNVFFDVSDADFVVRRGRSPVTIEAPTTLAAGSGVDATIPVRGWVVGACGVDLADVNVYAESPDGSVNLVADLVKTQPLPLLVLFSGTIRVSSLVRCPGTVRIVVEGADHCAEPLDQSVDVVVRDVGMPVVATSAQGGSTGMNGSYVLPFSASLRDDGRLDAASVVVAVTNPSQNAVVRQPVYTAQQVAPDRVDVTGTVTISNLASDKATIRVEVAGADFCTNRATDAQEVEVTGTTQPDGEAMGEDDDVTPVLATAFTGLRPNPFLGQTAVAFALARPARVALEVYAPSGARVRTLAASAFEAGRHRVTWDGRDDHGRRVPAGVYFVRFGADGVSRSAKALLLP